MVAACSLLSVSGVALHAEGPAPDIPDAASAPIPDTSRHAPWGVFFYHSLMTDNSLLEVLKADVTLKYGQMDTIDVSYELAHENVFKGHTQGQHGFWRPFAGSLYLAGRVLAENH